MSEDRYIQYTQRFFRRWVPVYDAFALPIAPIYRTAMRQLDCGPDRSIIDVCAGTGGMAVRCARAGSPVTAIDITPEMLDRARRKARGLPVEFRLMDARRLDFPDRSFDCAVVSLALHDMPRKVRAEVLREMARVTRQRIVILDYEFPRAAWLRRPLIAAVDLFESAYFRPFAEKGLQPTLLETGLAGAGTERRGLPLFAVYTIDLVAKRAASDDSARRGVTGEPA